MCYWNEFVTPGRHCTLAISFANDLTRAPVYLPLPCKYALRAFGQKNARHACKDDAKSNWCQTRTSTFGLNLETLLPSTVLLKLFATKCCCRFSTSLKEQQICWMPARNVQKMLERLCPTAAYEIMIDGHREGCCSAHCKFAHTKFAHR